MALLSAGSLPQKCSARSEWKLGHPAKRNSTKRRIRTNGWGLVGSLAPRRLSTSARLITARIQLAILQRSSFLSDEILKKFVLLHSLIYLKPQIAVPTASAPVAESSSPSCGS